MWTGCLSSFASDGPSYLRLRDGFSLKVIYSILHVEDIHDRCVLSIPLSETAPEAIYYCDLPKALLFKLVAPLNSPEVSNGQSPAVGYYFLRKGKKVDSPTPLTEVELLSQAKEISADHRAVNWTLATFDEGGAIGGKPPWYAGFNWLAFPLGFVLPVPFLVLLVLYVRLLLTLRRLRHGAQNAQPLSSGEVQP